MSGMPDDVRRALEETGVKFDENGEIIEDSFLDEQFSDDDDEEEEVDENEDELEEDEVEEDDDLEDEEDEEVDDDDEDEDEDELEDEPAPKAKKPKLRPKKKVKSKKSLTPKETPVPESQSVETQSILDKIEEIQKQISDSGSDEQGGDSQEKLLASLRQEAANFQKASMKRLASELEREVNRRLESKNTKYKDVINSQEWDDFLNTNHYGEPIGIKYSNAIKNQDWDTMVAFFDDFSEKYLEEPNEEDEEKPVRKTRKKSLADLAVPQNSKTNRKPKRRAKYDFKTSDYSENLDKMTRGKMTPEKFYEFEAKYEKAEQAGRVKLV